MNPTDHPLLQAWQHTLAADPTALALIEADPHRLVTRELLAAEATVIGAQLPPGIQRQRVVFSAPNGSTWLALALALLAADAVLVPLDPGETAARQLELAHAIGAPWSWRDGTFTPVALPLARRDRTATLIKLTSGSTGTPRALRFTAAQLLADGQQVAASMGITPTDRNLAAIPFGHSYGLGNLVVPLLAQGTPIIVAGAPLPRLLAAHAARWDATVFPAVPALLRLCTQSDLPPTAFSSLRTIISAGSPLAPDIAQTFHRRFARRIHGFYGSSETGGIAYDRTGEATLHGTGVGTALDHVAWEIVRGSRLRVTSPAVFTLGNRAAPPAGPGRFTVPDRVSLDSHRQLTLTGRLGRIVKLAGRRLELGDLEHQLRTLPGIDDAYVAPRAHRAEELGAALQTSLDERTARALLAAHLPPWKIPRRLLVLPAFPLTARGKPDTAALRRLLA